MEHGARILGVGGPNLAGGGGWDVAPLVLTCVLLLMCVGAGVRPRTAALVGCVVGSIVIDIFTDAFDVSPGLVLAPIVLVMAALALWGTTVP